MTGGVFGGFARLQHPVSPFLLSLGPASRPGPTLPRTLGPWALVPAGLALGPASSALLQLFRRQCLEKHFWAEPWALKPRSAGHQRRGGNGLLRWSAARARPSALPAVKTTLGDAHSPRRPPPTWFQQGLGGAPPARGRRVLDIQRLFGEVG